MNVMGIHEKLLAMSKTIGYIGKDGENTHFKFKYQKWEDVLVAVRNAAVEHKVSIMPTMTDLVRSEGRVTIKMRIDFEDTEKRDGIAVEWYGEAGSSDDKAIQKAATSAMKYALLKTLLIPVVGDDDPDGDAPVVKPEPKASPKVELPNWSELIVETFKGDKARSHDWAARVKAVKLKPVELFKSVYESNGNRATVEELEAALEEASKGQ